MRFLIREQEFETPLAAGRFQYDQNGKPTGAYESWRLTEIGDGYCFLRVDMDARETGREESILYHLLLGPQGQPERLKIRLLAMSRQWQGDVSFEGRSVMVSGEADGRRFEDELQLKGQYGIWFPAAFGLAVLLHNSLNQQTLTAVSINQDHSSLLSQESVNILSQQEEVILLGRQEIVVRPYLIRWAKQEKQLWLDQYRWPVKIDFGNGLMAKETQYIRYQ